MAIHSDPLPPSDSKYSSLFHGWIRAFDKHIVFERVKASYVIKVKILENHCFDWLQGDECCYSGRLSFEDKGVKDGFQNANDKDEYPFTRLNRLQVMSWLRKRVNVHDLL